MNKFIIIFSIFFLFFTIVKAEQIKQIEINGNQRVSEETIILYGKIEKNKDYSEIEINRIVENLYTTDFFEDIKIELKNGVLKVQLKEHPVINQLILIGEKKKGDKESNQRFN